MLVKYGVLSNKNLSTHVKDLIKQHDLINIKDYQLSEVRELRPQGGTSTKNEYYLHPRAFKKMFNEIKK